MECAVRQRSRRRLRRDTVMGQLGETLIGLAIPRPIAVVLYVAVFGGLEWLINRPDPDGPPFYDAERARMHHEFEAERARNIARNQAGARKRLT